MKSPWIRRTAMVVGALLLLLALAAAVLVATFDANRYKTLAVDWMKAERQRTLAIDGPIELSLFPRLAIKVSKVRLSEREPASKTEFASIDEAALSVQVLPLLRRQVVIDRVSASGVRAAYTRDAKGASNLDDLLARGSAAQPGTPAAPGAPPLRLNVSAVQFDNLQLRVRDDMQKLAGEITLQSFSSGRLANQVASPIALRAQVSLTQPKPLKLAIDGRATLVPDLDRGAATLTDLKLDLKGDAADVKAAALTVQAKRLFAHPSGQQVEFDALKLALRGQRGADPFEAALDWPQLQVDAKQLKGSALSGSFKFAGATALSGTLRSAAPSGNFEALRLPGVSLSVAGNAGPRKIDGTVKADLTLRGGRGAVALERLDVAATIAEPSLQPLQLTLRGSAGADAAAAQWAVEGALNANRFESQGSAGLAGAVPMVKASARFDSLDLNKLLSPDRPAPAAAAPADTPVQLDGLRAINGQFSFGANALAFRQYRVASAKAEATLDNGMLRISSLTGQSWGGSLAASGSADARSQRVAVKLAANGVNVNALLKDVAGKDLLEGTGRVTADLNTTGASLGALRSNLAGVAALELRDGAIKGINLARSMRQAKAALTGRQDVASKASSTEKTDFSELNVSARIDKGVAHSDDLDLKSPFLRIGGAGRFDIGRGTVDYTARASVVAAPSGQDGRELAALRGVTVPVRLSGPFEAIDWNIQWSGVAAAAVENKLKDKLAEKLGARLGGAPAAAGAAASAPATPRDQLKDRLKGLFK